jgi:hypothetical protein
MHPNWNVDHMTMSMISNCLIARHKHLWLGFRGREKEADLSISVNSWYSRLQSLQKTPLPPKIRHNHLWQQHLTRIFKGNMDSHLSPWNKLRCQHPSWHMLISTFEGIAKYQVLCPPDSSSWRQLPQGWASGPLAFVLPNICTYEIVEKTPQHFQGKYDNECSHNLMRLTHNDSDHHLY